MPYILDDDQPPTCTKNFAAVACVYSRGDLIKSLNLGGRMREYTLKKSKVIIVVLNNFIQSDTLTDRTVLA